MIKSLRLYEENSGGGSCVTGKKSVQYSPTRRHPPWIASSVGTQLYRTQAVDARS